MPAKQEPELKLNTSLKNLGGFLKVLAYILGALGLGAAGSVLSSSTDAAAKEDRIYALEQSCQRYDVRIATAETRLQAYEQNLIEVRKDLAEIRNTSTQILFLLQKGR